MTRTWLLAMVAAVILAACSRQAEPAAESQPVRGEPIRGEPIRSAATNKPSPAPSETNAVTAQKPAARPSTTEDGYVPVNFDVLASYTFTVPEGLIPSNQVGQSEAQIPESVKAYNGKKVALKGYMLPLKVDNGKVTEMLIMKDQSMCCYGSIPRINDWVSVKMPVDRGVKSVMDQPVTLFGKLRVGEMLENGYLVGIYAMDGERMEEEK